MTFFRFNFIPFLQVASISPMSTTRRIRNINVVYTTKNYGGLPQVQLTLWTLRADGSHRHHPQCPIGARELMRHSSVVIVPPSSASFLAGRWSLLYTLEQLIQGLSCTILHLYVYVAGILCINYTQAYFFFAGENKVPSWWHYRTELLVLYQPKRMSACTCAL